MAQPLYGDIQIILQSTKLADRPIMQELASPPTIEELRDHLYQMGRNKAPGEDGIILEALIAEAQNMIEHLHRIFLRVLGIP